MGSCIINQLNNTGGRPLVAIIRIPFSIVGHFNSAFFHLCGVTTVGKY
jgi:hypothetical protein